MVNRIVLSDKVRLSVYPFKCIFLFISDMHILLTIHRFFQIAKGLYKQNKNQALGEEGYFYGYLLRCCLTINRKNN